VSFGGGDQSRHRLTPEALLITVVRSPVQVSIRGV
jgi:hypothetical protein